MTGLIDERVVSVLNFRFCIEFGNDLVGNICRVEEAIEILEDILKVREEMLGTANPEVDEERRRLQELLKEAGRPRNKKAKSLHNLLASQSLRMKKQVATKIWSGGFSSRA